MRNKYEQQLHTLHEKLYQMGFLCEEAIACAAKALLEGDEGLRQKAITLEEDIDEAEHSIERLCVRLLLHQQPMASDLRHVTAAQKMITDMERIGDQAADIAHLTAKMQGRSIISGLRIADMARAASKMVTDSVDAFVRKDLEQAKAVIAYDDKLDKLFHIFRSEMVGHLRQANANAEDCVNLLLIAKYFERIGDHAENLAEWVIYYLTGSREDN